MGEQYRPNAGAQDGLAVDTGALIADIKREGFPSWRKECFSTPRNTLRSCGTTHDPLRASSMFVLTSAPGTPSLTHLMRMRCRMLMRCRMRMRCRMLMMPLPLLHIVRLATRRLDHMGG